MSVTLSPFSESTSPSVIGTPLEELDEDELELEEELELDEELELEDELELDEELELDDELELEEVLELDELLVLDEELLELDEPGTTITPDELLELEATPEELELAATPEEDEATIPEEPEDVIPEAPDAEELDELVLEEEEESATPELDELELDELTAGGLLPRLLLSLLSQACSKSVRPSRPTPRKRLRKNTVAGVPIGFPIAAEVAKLNGEMLVAGEGLALRSASVSIAW